MSGHAEPAAETAAADAAMEVARTAARRAGVELRMLSEPAELAMVVDVVDEVWQAPPGHSLIPVEELRALAHAGNYVAAAVDESRLLGVAVGFFAAPVGTALHSHMAGVVGSARGRGVGYALKLHQRAWALERGLSEITWTFDPLVRRNAYVNLAKLGARPREYVVDFYGEIDDGLNAGQGSDRVVVAWDITTSAGVQASAEPRAETDASMPTATWSDVVPALTESESGNPEIAPGAAWSRARTVLVQTPSDIEGLRRIDPATAWSWRVAVRDILGELLAEGAAVTGFTRSGSYVVERNVS
ncbi:hypothetical protein [Phytoactinopolyspora endophytica]|uniref:hypothetical protein n=1 Tax=Phytoactinopolyspora endophytica TaxID=1642495 RepID=UPI00197B3E28|nr:hypothetical protein [Phytoactinopolyspora endophytica]